MCNNYLLTLGIKTCSRSTMCTTGFPNFPASLGTDSGGNTDTAVTILIPDMNFTCNAKIAGFTFAGINRQQGHQDPVIQIWRKSRFQPQTGGTVYYKTEPAIAVNNSEVICDDGLPKIATQTYWCILKKNFHVSVQPGDILGLELPHINYDDFDIFFAEEGPMNYIFQKLYLFNSTVELSTSHQTLAQLPQITFNLTSGIKE